MDANAVYSQGVEKWNLSSSSINNVLFIYIKKENPQHEPSLFRHVLLISLLPSSSCDDFITPEMPETWAIITHKKICSVQLMEVLTLLSCPADVFYHRTH